MAGILFKSSHIWARHEKGHQGSSQLNNCCSFCHKTSSSSSAHFKHVSKHLREVALAVLPQTSFSDSDVESEVSEDTSRLSDPGTKRTTTGAQETPPVRMLWSIQISQVQALIMNHFPNCNIKLAARLGKACWESLTTYSTQQNENNRKNQCEGYNERKTDSTRVTYEPERCGQCPHSSNSTHVILSYKGYDGRAIGIEVSPQGDREIQGHRFKCSICGKEKQYRQKAELK